MNEPHDDETPAARLARIRAHLEGLFPGRSRGADTLTRAAIATMAPDVPAEVMDMMVPDPGSCAEVATLCGDVPRCGGASAASKQGREQSDPGFLENCLGCGA